MAHMKAAVKKTYGLKGEKIVNRKRESQERLHERFKVGALDSRIREALHENGTVRRFLNAREDARKRRKEIKPQKIRSIGKLKASGEIFLFASEREAPLPRMRIRERCGAAASEKRGGQRGKDESSLHHFFVSGRDGILRDSLSARVLASSALVRAA